jgi:hypothetical protein
MIREVKSTGLGVCCAQCPMRQGVRPCLLLLGPYCLAAPTVVSLICGSHELVRRAALRRFQGTRDRTDVCFIRPPPRLVGVTGMSAPEKPHRRRICETVISCPCVFRDTAGMMRAGASRPSAIRSLARCLGLRSWSVPGTCARGCALPSVISAMGERQPTLGS